MKMIVGLIVLSGFAAQGLVAEAPTPRGLLVTTEELAAVEARVMTRVREYQEMSCVRPVLRGAPVPGSGSAAVAAFGEGDGALRDCDRFLGDNKEPFFPDDFDAFIETGEGGEADLLDELRESCSQLPAAASAAVAHGDVCAPWRPGVRGNPSFFPLLRSSKVSVILGRAAYRPEDALSHARSALDRMRLDQDTIRGGGTLIAAMVSFASSVQIQAPWLTWLLDRGDLTAAGYAEVADALGILAGTEPSIAAVLEADSYWSFLQVLFPIIQGPDWIPPGGWDEGHRPAAEDESTGPFGTRFFIDEQTDAAILVVAMDEVQRAQIAACPLDATTMECVAGLRRHEAELVARSKVSDVIRVIRILGSSDLRLAIRQTIVDILSGVVTPAFDRYVEKYALRALRIAALRIHASALREWVETGTCREDFSHGGWAELTRDPVFGGSLGVSRDPENGEWVIRAAGTLKDQSAEEDVGYRFHCPPGRSS